MLGQPTGVPIGIPACPLTMNARWVEYYAERGYNVLTYKTVRSTARACYPLPNLLPVRAAAVDGTG